MDGTGLTHSDQVTPSDRFHPDPLPILLGQLQSGDAAVRNQAVLQISRLGPLASEAVPTLQVLLNDEDAELRKSVARALGQMGASATPALAEALHHEDKEVRRQAVWALTRMGPAAIEAISDLATALKDADPRTATGAAQALANMGPAAADAVPALLAALCQKNRVLCRMIARALSDIGPTALPAIMERLSDPDPYVRREVAVAIGFMGRHALPALPTLVHHLKTFDETPPAEAPPPEMTSTTRVTPIRATAPDLVDHRVVLIEALGRLGPAAGAARECLISLLNARSKLVSQAASQALLRIMGWS